MVGVVPCCVEEKALDINIPFSVEHTNVGKELDVVACEEVFAICYVSICHAHEHAVISMAKPV